MEPTSNVDELRASLEALQAKNAELEARSRESAELVKVAQAERDELAATLAGVGDALLAVDLSGRTIFANAAYQQRFGPAPPLCDPAGKPLPAELYPEARAARGEHFVTEFMIMEPDGAVHHFEANGHPIDGPEGLAGGVVVIRDFTERSLRRLQDSFLAMASHELRTPLVPLRGYLDMLLRLMPDGPDPRLRRYADRARHESVRLTGLIEDLIDAARLQTGKIDLDLEPLDLEAVVGRAVEIARATAGAPLIHVEADHAAGPLIARGNAARLEQVVANLVANAIWHAAGTPRIDIRLGHAKNEGSGPAEISVQDYGPGIAAEHLPHIFSSFYQGNQRVRPSRGGMGLGLFICREIVAAHGGSISVDSHEGRGAKFVVRLPSEPPTPENQGKASSQSEERRVTS